MRDLNLPELKNSGFEIRNCYPGVVVVQRALPVPRGQVDLLADRIRML